MFRIPYKSWIFKRENVTGDSILTENGLFSSGDCEVSRRASIFVVEDNPGVCEAIRVILEDFGYVVPEWNESGEAAVRRIGEVKPDLVLMDINLSGEMDGVEAAIQIRELYDIPVIFLTGNDDPSLNHRITVSRAYGFLIKPFNERELQLTIEIALHKHQMNRSIRRSERFYRTLAEALNEGIILINPDGSVRYMNGVARSMLQHMAPEEDCPQEGQLPEIHSALFRDELLQNLDTILSSGNAVQKVIVIPVHGHDLWIDLRLIPVSDDRWVSPEVMVIMRDVTLQMEFEAEVRRVGLSQIEENMERFQILNDQIRNPLQVLTGLIDLHETEYKSKYMEQVATIDRVVYDFDSAWVRSEKVRRFLLTHYGHGLFLKK